MSDLIKNNLIKKNLIKNNLIKKNLIKKNLIRKDKISKVIKVIKVNSILTDNEIEKKAGSYFPESHYKKIINTNCDVYGILEDGTEKLLLKFRKNVIPNNICKNAFLALVKHAQHKNYNRGAAAGKLNIKKLPKYIGKITKKDCFRIFYNTRAGKKTKDNVGNMAMSNIAGYYDKPDRNEYMNRNRKTKKQTHQNSKSGKKSKSSKSSKNSKSGKSGYDMYGIPLCRTTQFTANEIEKWNNTIPLIKEADKQFKQLIPNRHQIQLARAQNTPKYQIENTAYSTITLNYDWRTACHKDKGDLEEGFGNLIVLEKSQSIPGSCKSFRGGYLGFPKWGIAVDVRQGDFLAMDVHEFHCNTPIEGTGRLSIVCYLRKNMIKCSR